MTPYGNTPAVLFLCIFLGTSTSAHAAAFLPTVASSKDLAGPSLVSDLWIAPSLFRHSIAPQGRYERAAPFFLFGGLFSSGSATNVGGELARFPNLAMTGTKYDNLSEYIRLWSKLFETDAKGAGLTTPVKVFPSIGVSDGEDEVLTTSGVRIIFQKTTTGSAYKSKDEEKSPEEADGSGGGNASEDTDEIKKEGGVEVLVERLSGGEVQLRAKRCNFDEDTMIKEMSEEAIIKNLREAINVWKKEQQ